MTKETLGLPPHSYARFNAGNLWGLMPIGNDEADPALGNAHPVVFSEEPITLHYMTKTDRTYIAHDLPQPVVRDIFAPGSGRRSELRIGWEGIAIGVLLAGYALLSSAVIFKVAAFGSLFVG